MEIHNKDGRTYDISGTGTPLRRWFYGYEAGFGYFEREVNVTATGGMLEWTKSWQDLAGRIVRTQQTGRTAATRYYNAAGRLEKTIDPDGVVTLYSSNPSGDLSTTVLDVDRDGVAGVVDHVASNTLQVVSAHGTVVKRTESKIINAAGVEELASQSDSSVDGRRQWSTNWGQQAASVITYGPAGTRTEVDTLPDGRTQTRVYTQGRLVSETSAAAGGSPVLRSVTYSYDPHGRLQSATDARNGTTYYTYDAMDRALTVTTPVPGPGLAAQTTTHAYDSMGRETVTTLPDNSQVTNEYFVTGGLKKRSGSQIPTEEYTYDSQGRVKTMTTTGQAGPATTTWTYQVTTGWLATKTYPGGDFISSTYSSAGRLLTRTTGRGVMRTYAHDQGGRLTGVDYSDTTPDVTYTLNRLGQITGITDGIGTRNRTVATDGRLLSENHTAGLLAGASIGQVYDSLLRRQTFSAATGGPAFQATWTYDGASRLQTVTSGSGVTTYAYAANSGLITGVSTTHGGNPALATTSAYDALQRLSSISSTANGTVVSSHGYTYDNLNRRAESVLEDGKKWQCQYDAMGQVIAGRKKTAAGADVPGMDFAYAFDGIGNRTSATVNGRTGTYTADAANRYTQRQVPGAFDLRGRASVLSKVTVNGGPVQRLDEYFYKEIAADNSAAPQYPGVSVLAVANHLGPDGEDLKSESGGNFFLPKTPETFAYDAEGNLTADGRWSYTWDGENRLIRQETLGSVPAAAKRKLEFSYDSESRRIRKQVFSWSGTAWVLQKDLRFLFDGWNLIAELDATNTMLRNFVWGFDLSRTPEEAGGVGGLLAIREGAESHLPCYDGNGNVMALVKASDRSISARYEYGPFGEALVVEENGVANPFRFSTKYTDVETGWLYYGYRYYDPVMGRWPSRDPIGEKGGVNLYGFVGNDGVNQWDILGLLWELGRLGEGPSRVGAHAPALENMRDREVYANLLRDANNMGLVSSFAETLALRYLSGSGKDYVATVEMGKMRQKDESLKSTIEMMLRFGVKWVDKNADREVRDIRANPGGDSVGGWLLRSQRDSYTFYALGNYYLGVSGKMWCDGGKITFVYYWAIDDVYDFENSDAIATPFSRDWHWHRMARLGWAKPFRVSGERWGTIKWEQGKPPSQIEVP